MIRALAEASNNDSEIAKLAAMAFPTFLVKATEPVASASLELLQCLASAARETISDATVVPLVFAALRSYNELTHLARGALLALAQSAVSSPAGYRSGQAFIRGITRNLTAPACIDVGLSLACAIFSSPYATSRDDAVASLIREVSVVAAAALP